MGPLAAQADSDPPITCKPDEQKAMIAFGFTNTTGIGNVAVCDKPEAFHTETGLVRIRDAIDQKMAARVSIISVIPLDH